MADASMGFSSRLSMAAAGTAIAAYGESHEFVSEGLRRTSTILDTSGIRGTRSHATGRTRDGTYRVEGAIRMHATPTMLNLLLPRILGTSAGSNVFALAEALPQFDVLVDRVAERFVYGGCKVNRALFRGHAGGLLELVLDLAGKTETTSATAFPAIAPPTDPPYVFQDGALTLLSTTRKMLAFELVVDNALAVRFTNSVAASDVSPADRIVTFRCRTPFTADEIDLYGPGAAGGAAAALTFTNGAASVAFSLAAVQFADVSPVVPGKEEIVLTLEGVARRTAGASELTVTNIVP